MAASAVVNFAVALRLRRVARRTGTPAIEGDAAHLASDVWTSGATAAGLALVALTGWTALDAIVALAVAGYVMSVGLRLAWRAGHVLLDGSLPESEIDVIEDVLAASSATSEFHALRGRRAAPSAWSTCTWLSPPTRPCAAATP